MWLWSVVFEQVRPLPDFPWVSWIASERQSEATYRQEGYLRQDHQYVIFVYTVAGEGRFRDPHGEYALTPGTGFLCEACDPATAYYCPEDATTPWDTVFVCLHGQAVRTLTRQMVAQYGYLYRLPAYARVIRTLLEWRNAPHPHHQVTTAESMAMAMDLLCGLVECRDHEHRGDNTHQLVLRAREFISQHIDHPLNATRLATRLGISREHLGRLFQTHLGETPYQYILRQKIHLACRLLKETTLSIKEISDRTGCASQALFTERFKSIMHTTPSEYRTRIGVRTIIKQESF